MKKVAFTLVSKNYLHYALTLRGSFLKHSKDYDFKIVLVDMAESLEDINSFRGLLSFGLVGFYEIKNSVHCPRLEEMLLKYNIVEMNTATKPFVIEYLLRKGYKKVLYFDPDIYWLNSANELDKLLDYNNILLTPHTVGALPLDGKGPDYKFIMRAGIYNLGFIGIRSSLETIRLCRWWQDRVSDHCFIDQHPQLFVDQRWADWFPAYFNGVYIIKDKGYNAAYWNLHDRYIHKKGEAWYAGKDTLKFYHFSGIETTDYEQISKHQNRYNIHTIPDIAELFGDYSNQLRKNGEATYKTRPYYFSKTPTTQRIGLNIAGYTSASTGVGECARGFIKKLYYSAVPFSTYDLNEHKQGRVFDTTVLFVNADQIDLVLKENPVLSTAKRVGVFWWEVENLFPFFNAFHNVNSVLVFSEYVHGIMKKFGPKDLIIQKIPFPLVMNTQPVATKQDYRRRHKLADDDFVFLFNFDYLSCFERKNPLAVIQAFETALPTESNAKLIIKTNNSHFFGEEHLQLETAIENSLARDRIIRLDYVMSKPEIVTLFQICDSYISLHRAEGLGIGMMEAMALGKPVIATAYSGNMEFMTEQNTLLVDYKKTKIVKPFMQHYLEGTEWAEPDINGAARYMHNIFYNKKLRAEKGRNAKESIRNYTDEIRYSEQLYDFIRGIHEQ